MPPTSQCPPAHPYSCLSQGTHRYFSRVTLTSAILKVDVVFDVAMMSTPNVLTTVNVTSYTTNVLTPRAVIRFLSTHGVG